MLEIAQVDHSIIVFFKQLFESEEEIDIEKIHLKTKAKCVRMLCMVMYTNGYR